MSVRWSLRPASDTDRAFLFALHRAAMREYVDAIWGWRDDEQERYFDERFVPERLQVIEVDRVGIGLLAVEERTEEIFLAGIELQPEWQGRGIGGALLGELLAMAASRGTPLTLQVLKSNPRAKELYERLGLHVGGETETHFLMTTPFERQAGESSASVPD